MINSPRSLKACKELGILPAELYKISIEEFRNQNPSTITIDEKILKFRYEGYEKFRKDSIELVKKRREVLINKEKNGRKAERAETNFVIRSLEKIKEGERKAMENLKNQQKKNIKNIIEEQINREILKKAEKKKEWRQQKREEKLMKERKENEENKKKS